MMLFVSLIFVKHQERPVEVSIEWPCTWRQFASCVSKHCGSEHMNYLEDITLWMGHRFHSRVAGIGIGGSPNCFLPLWLTYGDTEPDLQGELQNYLLSDLASVIVAYWIPRTFQILYKHDSALNAPTLEFEP